jgi:3-hydroxyisobutyrate dehydrogenase-like beta-hydroxyacid dehydrogenase
MKKNLCKRGYTTRSIDNELMKVDKLDRNNLLQYRTDKSKTDRVPVVLTYSKGLPHVSEVMKKKMTVLHKSEKMKKSVHKTTNFSIQTR